MAGAFALDRGFRKREIEKGVREWGCGSSGCRVQRGTPKKKCGRIDGICRQGQAPYGDVSKSVRLGVILPRSDRFEHGVFAGGLDYWARRRREQKNSQISRPAAS